jgi:putative ABC transport system permease protein
MSSLPLSYNIRNLIVRWKVTLLAIGGIALVVAVMLVLVAMSNGFRMALRSTGSPENAMVVQRGAQSELNDACSRESANLIMVDRRIAHDAQGRVLASPEIMVVNNMQRRQDGESVNVVVRGVTLMAFEVRNTVRIVEGRAFTPGLYELVVGTKARSATSASMSDSRSACSDAAGRWSASSRPTAAASRARSGATST